MASERVQRRIARVLDQAEEAADQSNWVKVKDLTENILAFDPGNVDALEFLAAAERGLSGSGTPQSVSSTALPTIPLEQPTSFASGRYEVNRFLGEGDRGTGFLH